MKKISKVWSAARLVVVAVVLFVGLLAPVLAQAASRAEQVLALVNAERRKAGLGPLALSQRCQAQADKRAKEIFQRGRFNHKGAFNGLRGYGWMGESTRDVGCRRSAAAGPRLSAVPSAGNAADSVLRDGLPTPVGSLTTGQIDAATVDLPSWVLYTASRYAKTVA